MPEDFLQFITLKLCIYEKSILTQNKHKQYDCGKHIHTPRKQLLDDHNPN